MNERYDVEITAQKGCYRDNNVQLLPLGVLVFRAFDLEEANKRVEELAFKRVPYSWKGCGMNFKWLFTVTLPEEILKKLQKKET